MPLVLICMIAVAHWTLQNVAARAQSPFNVEEFKSRVLGAGEKADERALLQHLTNVAKNRAVDKQAERKFVDSLISSIDSDIVDRPGGKTYLKLVARTLVGIGLWPSSSPREATDRLGGLANSLRNSSNDLDRSLASALDDAIARAPNMYIKLLRHYTPVYDDMRVLVEDRLQRLLDISYVRDSKYAYYIRAMLAAKYAELALFKADYEVPICSQQNVADRNYLKRSNGYATELLAEINAKDGATVPEDIGKLRNDLFYQLALNAVLACETETALRYVTLLRAKQDDEDTSGIVADHVYVFRHLRTRREAREVVRTLETPDGRQVSQTEIVPDSSDVKRKFYNPRQLAMYLCRVGLTPQIISIAELKAKLDEFENIDFWIDVSTLSFVENGVESAAVNAFREQLQARSVRLAKRVPAFANRATEQSTTAGVLRSSGAAGSMCAALGSLPGIESLDAVLAAPMISPAYAPKSNRRGYTGARIGGYLSAAEAQALARALRENFPDWSVLIGRPDIYD